MFRFEFFALINAHTPNELLLIHVVAVSHKLSGLWSNLLVCYNDIGGLANGLFQAMVKCYYNHRRHTWCYTYFELNIAPLVLNDMLFSLWSSLTAHTAVTSRVDNA